MGKALPSEGLAGKAFKAVLGKDKKKSNSVDEDGTDHSDEARTDTQLEEAALKRKNKRTSFITTPDKASSMKSFLGPKAKGI